MNFLFLTLVLITTVLSSCSDFEEGRRHRIAFNSLYLFSFKSIIYKANGKELYNFTRGATGQLPLLGERLVSGLSWLCTLNSIREAWPP